MRVLSSPSPQRSASPLAGKSTGCSPRDLQDG
jgi:hypothetical protein